MLTVRQEVAKRLLVYWRTSKKVPDSYNSKLGLGAPSIENDKPFNGFGINGKRYINGVCKK